MKEDKTIFTLRRMAWQRAKGELMSYLETFWTEYQSDGSKIDNGYEKNQDIINKFIIEFEDNQ